MKKSIILISSLLFVFATQISVIAQESDQEYNYNSLHPIRSADIMYKQTIWVRMDLREKKNEPFFAKNRQITKVVIDAVKAGILRPYKNDSLKTRMPNNEFEENLTIPGVGGDDGGFGDDSWGDSGGGGWGDSGGGGWGDSGGGGWGDSGGGGGGGDASASSAENNQFFPEQIYSVELKIDQIFDSRRGRMYNDIQSVKLIIPSEYIPSGIEKELATFSYKELVENVFRDNPNAMWVNPQNSSNYRNFADAFELGLFDFKLIRFSNPRDKYIDEYYPGNYKKSLLESLNYRFKVVEFESNLWSN